MPDTTGAERVTEGDVRVDRDGDTYRVDRIHGGWCWVTWLDEEAGRLPLPPYLTLAEAKYDRLADPAPQEAYEHVKPHIEGSDTHE